MWNKKNNFTGSLLTAAVILSYGIYLDNGGCEQYIEWCESTIDSSRAIFYYFVIYTAFSFPLFLLPPHYFTRFWHFALWGLPLTLGAIIYINLTYDSGLFGFGAGFDLLLVGACYLFFVLGSLIQIARAWWTGR
jgi:hypothetical protein